MTEVCLCGHTRKSHRSQADECKVCESCPEFVLDDQEAMFASDDNPSPGGES